MARADRKPIEIRSLRVQYGRLVAVDGLDLCARSGEVVALLGPNGAGKTSTVEALEGYRRPAEGTVRLCGYDPVADRGTVSSFLGIMLQRGGVYPAMGPLSALRLFASYYRSPETPEHLLELVGLDRVAKTPWRRLSGGEQQRLSLALALVGRPEVCVLDEPTSGVDPEGRQVMREAIAQLRERGACTLLTTHELHEAERVADRVFILASGRLVASGTCDELSRMAGPSAVRWSSSPGLATGPLATRLGAPVREEEPGRYRAETSGGPATVATIAGWLAEQGLPLNDIRAGRAPLEEVYLKLTSGASAGAGEPGGAGEGEVPGEGRRR